MILSNREIVEAVEAGDIIIQPLEHDDPSASPFNTMAVDLTLASTITIPRRSPVSHRLDRPYDADYVAQNADTLVATSLQPVVLDPNTFVLATTREWVGLPIRRNRPTYAARVEGKSSRARLGMLVHFTAPTIHSGFHGHITLEVINLGPDSIQLVPGVSVCQLIFECVSRPPVDAPNQFTGQLDAAGRTRI